MSETINTSGTINFKPSYIRRILVDTNLLSRNLCRGTTLKGKQCNRKGIHEGYCHDHNQNY